MFTILYYEWMNTILVLLQIWHIDYGPHTIDIEYGIRLKTKDYWLNTIDLQLFTSPKMHIVSHKVYSIVTDSTLCPTSALASCPICHSQLYQMGHNAVLRWWTSL